MLFRQKVALPFAVAVALFTLDVADPGAARANEIQANEIQAEGAPSGPGDLQVAASPVHQVTIKVDVNNGDYVTAKQVVLKIEPAYGNDSDARASLTGPGNVQLPEGSYKIVATLEQMRIEDRLQVGGPTTHTVAVQAGFATLKWIEQIGSKAIKDAVQWDILTYRKVNGERQLIASLVGSQPRLTLPEGWYIAEATYKGKVKRLAIEVANGRQYDYVLCASC